MQPLHKKVEESEPQGRYSFVVEAWPILFACALVLMALWGWMFWASRQDQEEEDGSSHNRIYRTP